MTSKKKHVAPEPGTSGPVTPLVPSQPLAAASVPGALLRIATVVAVIGLSKPTIYRMMERGEFPKAVQLSKHCVAWRQEEVAAWIASRSAS
jgi:prophage regulatory protein